MTTTNLYSAKKLEKTHKSNYLPNYIYSFDTLKSLFWESYKNDGV